MKRRIGFGAMTKAKVSSDRSGQSMQPHIMTKEREHAPHHVQAWDKAHNSQNSVNHSHRLGVGAGTGERTIGQKTPETNGDVYDVVQDIDRKETEEIAIRSFHRKVRCMPWRHHAKGWKETENTHSKISNTGNKSEFSCLHNKSLSHPVKCRVGLFQFCASPFPAINDAKTFPQVFCRGTVYLSGSHQLRLDHENI